MTLRSVSSSCYSPQPELNPRVLISFNFFKKNDEDLRSYMASYIFVVK